MLGKGQTLPCAENRGFIQQAAIDGAETPGARPRGCGLHFVGNQEPLKTEEVEGPVWMCISEKLLWTGWQVTITERTARRSLDWFRG